MQKSAQFLIYIFVPLRLDSSSVGNSSCYKDTFWGNWAKFCSFFVLSAKVDFKQLIILFWNELFLFLSSFFWKAKPDQNIRTTEVMLAFHLARLCFSMTNQEMPCLKMYSGFWSHLDKILPFRQAGWIPDTCRFIWQRVHGYFSQQSQNINTESVWFKYPFGNKNDEPGFIACYFASYLCIEQLFWHTKSCVSNQICHLGNGNTVQD